MKIIIISLLLITSNIFSATLFDEEIERYNRKKNDTFEESKEKVISLLGSWVTDSHILIEFIEEEGYYIGIAKADIYDNTSLFLNGEGILRFKKEKGLVHKGRVKYLSRDGRKRWKDATFKLKDNTMFDGTTLYRKVLSTKFNIKKRRVNRRTLRRRTQALKQIKSIDWRQRLEGVRTLSKLKDRSTVPQLTPLLFDNNRLVREEAHKLLTVINNKQSINGLSELLMETKTSLTKSRKKNVSLYGYWTNGDNSFRLFLAKNSSLEVTSNGKREAGLYIDSKKEIAIQFTSGEQVIFNYKIEGDILKLSSPDNSKELFLKKEK